MDFDIKQLKKKIIYRSRYRGTKEMDKLLGSFTEKYIDVLDNDNLISLEKLLNIDDNNLYNYFNDLKTDVDIENNKINLLFKTFKYNEK